jgi:thioredoxin reductase (NADPH)
MSEEFEAVIIGAGVGGLAAGIYGERSGVKCVVLEMGAPGGQTAIAPWVENYPGFKKITGMELMNNVINHAQEYVEIRTGQYVKSIEKADSGFLLKTDNVEYNTKAIIFATGAAHRRLGVPGEKEFGGRGVSFCATCDGFFFKGKKVAVVGGGDSAVLEAMYLKDLGCDVSVIHRRDELRAKKAIQDDYLEGGGKIIWDSVVKEIKGEGLVTGVELLNKKTSEKSTLPVDGVFISIGIIPNSGLAKELGVQLDDDGYIAVGRDMRTSVPMVFAAGDVAGGVKQTIVAAGEGAIAALSAYEDVRRPSHLAK